MKHIRQHSVDALTFRADRIQELDTVADMIGGDDHRSVSVYYVHDGVDWTEDGGFPTQDAFAEVLGVVIGGDDPSFPAEVLDRAQAQDFFGHDRITQWEFRATEALWG